MSAYVEGFQELRTIPALRTPTLVWSMHEQRCAQSAPTTE
jgi:hypothetical protein